MRKTSKYRKPEFWLQLIANIFGALLATGVFLPDSLGAKLIAAGVLVLANLGFVAPIAKRGLMHAILSRSSHHFAIKGLKGKDGGEFLSDFAYDMFGNMFRATQVLLYRTKSGEIIAVPIGFLSDGFSIPTLIKWMFWGIDAKYLAAAFIHDYLYSLQTYKRAFCDSVLREAMLVLGATEFLANVIYIGVRGGGWIGWAIDAQDVQEVAENSTDIAELISTVEAQSEIVFTEITPENENMRNVWAFTPALSLCRHPHQKILQLRWAQKQETCNAV
jgi:hypothetical protein